jgi:hypothetical protein
MLKAMPGPARAACKLYLDQDPTRSLRQLAKACAEHGIKASSPTLKRWSARYGWQQQIAEHDRKLSEQSMAITISNGVRALRSHFKILDSAKERFGGLDDPEGSSTAPTRRKRALKITVSNYIRLLKAEDQLYKRLDWLERSRLDAPVSSPSTYTDEELDVMVSALARHRHGLPGA